MAKRMDIKDLNIYYGSFHAVADVACRCSREASRRSSARRAAGSPPCCAP